MNQRVNTVEKIRGMIKKLSRAEQLVADYIVNHPDEVIHMSVSDLANASGVSDATIIRASQKIGCGSYQDLKISLAQDIVTPMQAVNEDISEGDTPQIVIEKVFRTSLAAIQDTFKILDINKMVLAANYLSSAERLIICGLGNSHSLALDMQHKFARLGYNATVPIDNHMMTIMASSLKKGDVLVGISHSGSSRDIVHAASIARVNGAHVIAMTNQGSSPLSENSDVTLYTAASETKYRALALSSRTALITIMDCLYTLVALKKGASASVLFFQIEKNLGETKF